MSKLLERIEKTGAATAALPDYDESMGTLEIRDIYPMGQGDSETVALNTAVDGRSQPRQFFDPEELERLASELREHGQLEPIVVRHLGKGEDDRNKWGIIGGERRWRAMQMNGETKIKVNVVTADSRKAYRLSIIADIHNQSHTPIERGLSLLECKSDMTDELEIYLAGAGRTQRGPGRNRPLTDQEYANLHAKWDNLPIWVQKSIERSEKGDTPRRPTVNWSDVAESVGMTERMIQEYVRIAEVARTDVDVSKAVAQGQIKTRHAMALASVPNKTDRDTLLGEIVDQKLSGPVAQQRARELTGKSTTAPVTNKHGEFQEKGSSKAAGRDIWDETLGNAVGAVARLDISTIPANKKKEAKAMLASLRVEIEQLEAQL